MSGPVKVATFKGGPKYSGRTQPKCSVLSIWFLTEISGILAEWKAPHCVNMILLDKHK